MKNLNTITIELLNTFITEINEILEEGNEENYEIRQDIEIGFERIILTDGNDTFTVIWNGDENMVGKQTYTLRKKSLETIYEIDEDIHSEIADFLTYKFRMQEQKKYIVSKGDDLSILDKRDERRTIKIPSKRQESLRNTISSKVGNLGDIFKIELDVERDCYDAIEFAFYFSHILNGITYKEHIYFTCLTEDCIEEYTSESIEAFEYCFIYDKEKVKIEVKIIDECQK